VESDERKQLDRILAYAADRGIAIPPDLLLELAQDNTQTLLDGLRLPLYTLTTPGLVPPPKKGGLVLWSQGWQPPPSPGAYYFNASTSAAASSSSEAFPVGSVFLAVVATDPATLLGYGTWSAFGTGRVLIGVDVTDLDFDTVEKTGGAKTVASAGTVDSISGGTPAGTNDSISGGTPAGTITWPVGVPTFAGDALAGHTHTFTGTALAGHTHTFAGSAVNTGVADVGATKVGATTSTITLKAHTHSVTAAGTNDSVSGGTPAGTNNSVSGGTPAGTISWPVGVPTFAGNALAGHTHTFAGAALAGHTHTYAGAATSVVQPYITVYMWKRTA
jgi:hypothetical protein